MPAFAKGERAGDFDYYVLALSWTPTWCELTGDERQSPQCDPGQGFGFTLHGLWPQYDEGWPSYCPTPKRNPSRQQTAEMADIMGSAGLAWHQWNKHGRCTGLSAHDYFEKSRQAYGDIKRPEILRELKTEIKVDAGVIKAAFQEENPDLKDDMLAVTCKANHIQEIRICLDKKLSPTTCNTSWRSCSGESYQLDPIR